MHGVLERRHERADLRRHLRQRHRRDPGHRRQRHPVVRRLHRRHHRHRLADSCTSVPAIAQVYEDLITTYHVPRIDLDVEGTSVTNTAGINRRNQAIAMTEAWAAAHHRSIQFSYTLPTFPTGLPAAELSVLQNAVADGAKITTVNLLTFDYYIGTQQNMLTDTETAASPWSASCSRCTPMNRRGSCGTWSASPRCPASTTSARTRRSPRLTRSTLLLWAERTGHRHPVVLGAAARQRRLPGHQGRRHLLRPRRSRPGSSATSSSCSPGRPVSPQG